MIDLDNISFDHCIKCTVCTVYCPVARVSPRFPGPKQSGPDTERLRIKSPQLVDASLKYCSNCKRCEIACPSDVRIADIIQAARWRYSRGGFRVRDFFLSRTDLVGGLATRTSSLANAVSGARGMRRLMARGLKISAERPFPRYERGTFRRWFERRGPDPAGHAGEVVYFHGCYVNYNDHALGRAVVRCLNALGYGVRLAPEKCCGVPLIAGGFLAAAARNARHNIRVLTGAVAGTDRRIVSASSTCAFALKHEYLSLLELDNREIADRIDHVSRFICREFDRGNGPPLRPVPLTVAYHAPCHLERMGGQVHTIELLRRIPGLRLKLLHSDCCGLAGTYGFKAEYHPIAQDVGEALFQRIREIQPDLVATDCETCKWQLEMNTGLAVVHPVTLLSRALGPRPAGSTVSSPPGSP